MLLHWAHLSFVHLMAQQFTKEYVFIWRKQLYFVFSGKEMGDGIITGEKLWKNILIIFFPCVYYKTSDMLILYLIFLFSLLEMWHLFINSVSISVSYFTEKKKKKGNHLFILMEWQHSEKVRICKKALVCDHLSWGRLASYTCK